MVARNKIVLSGKFGVSTPEVWSISTHWTLDGGGAVLSQVECQSWATRIATALGAGETALAAMVSQWGTGTDMTKVDVYGYGPTGPAVAQGSATFGLSGSGTPRLPFQDAICVTLQTGFAGARRRGRFYLPAHGCTVGSDGKWSQSAGFATAVADMLELMSDIDGTSTAIPVVYSPTGNFVTAVTAVKVGNVLDTQRRRRDALTESFQTAAVTI